MMNLSQIRYFLNLTETLNFTRAAELSAISQPAFTKAIQKLEGELGGQLLFRDGKDTRLTELGRTIRVEFEKILEIAARTKELANQIVSEDRLELCIGIASTLGPEPVSGLIDSFLSDMPHVDITIEFINQNVAIELVLSGALDACFCADINPENPKLQSVPLYSERLLLAAAADHRFSEVDEIPSNELVKETYIDRVHCDFRKRVIEHFMDNGVLMNAKLRANREDWVQNAVARGVGVALVPEYAIMHNQIQMKAVSGLSLSRQIALLTIFGSASSPAVRSLIQAAKKYAWPSSIK